MDITERIIDNNPALLTKEIIDAVNKQTIFWSDDRCTHWFFDFKVGDLWVSAWSINNELTECIVDIYKE